ncbi:hypothetical protein O6R05_08015 [Peptoniphilus equinus]|uniref:Uncharacterized protein n=1 Tax=Peptoniphilus equinus TaxID=3016343 RepID=A0ABY7QT31_9FIRM|nr:hypothetical protein [Peptoniphilus equinus]WBW49937.1 hypothetical protein O6R05_08015 [Peptoniphilus equinus]
MIRISFNDEGVTTDFLVVSSMEKAEAFVRSLPFHLDQKGYFLLEDELPNVFYGDVGGGTVVLSRYMFRQGARIDIHLTPLDWYDATGGTRRIDAYQVDAKEVATYVATREQAFQQVQETYEKQGFRVYRAYRDSEDGEAVVIEKDGECHFLKHLDPMFVETVLRDVKTL